MNVAEAAEKHGVSQQRIRNLIYNGRLKSKKVGGQHQIDEESFNALSDQSHQSIPVTERVTLLEQRLAEVERFLDFVVEQSVPPQPAPETEEVEAEPQADEPGRVEEPPESPPDVSADMLIESMSALFGDPSAWAKQALAVVGEPDASLPSGMRYTAVEPDHPNVTAFSLEGAVQAYRLNQPEEVVDEVRERITAAGQMWWVAVYPDNPPPADLQQLNDVVNHSQLLAILEMAHGGAT